MDSTNFELRPKQETPDQAFGRRLTRTLRAETCWDDAGPAERREKLLEYPHMKQRPLITSREWEIPKGETSQEPLKYMTIGSQFRLEWRGLGFCDKKETVLSVAAGLPLTIALSEPHAICAVGDRKEARLRVVKGEGVYFY
jgi:hypothetical protein